METYSFLRHMADSWVLLAMTLGFLGLCVWACASGPVRLGLPPRQPQHA